MMEGSYWQRVWQTRRDPRCDRTGQRPTVPVIVQTNAIVLLGHHIGASFMVAKPIDGLEPPEDFGNETSH